MTSIAVVFLYSYVNPVHELRAKEIILDEFPHLDLLSLSHEVYPKPPEFERISTTLVNAYVGPPIVRYVDSSRRPFPPPGSGRLPVGHLFGGRRPRRASQDTATRHDELRADGWRGGQRARSAARVGLGNVVSVDMGGTSYDVCLIREGRPEVRSHWNWRHRYCIALPIVDIHAIGVGGGSLIRFANGGLTVGPEFGRELAGTRLLRQGQLTEPTVTDANLVLGRLDPTSFCRNSRLHLDVDGAHRALSTVGTAITMSAEEPAVAAIDIIDSHMADTVAASSSPEQERDSPRPRFWLPSGAWGALHAARQ